MFEFCENSEKSGRHLCCEKYENRASTSDYIQYILLCCEKYENRASISDVHIYITAVRNMRTKHLFQMYIYTYPL
jgi:hypothetical protein